MCSMAPALQERKAAMRLGNWIFLPQQLAMGLPKSCGLGVCNPERERERKRERERGGGGWSGVGWVGVEGDTKV